MQTTSSSTRNGEFLIQQPILSGQKLGARDVDGNGEVSLPDLAILVLYHGHTNYHP